MYIITENGFSRKRENILYNLNIIKLNLNNGNMYNWYSLLDRFYLSVKEGSRSEKYLKLDTTGNLNKEMRY